LDPSNGRDFRIGQDGEGRVKVSSRFVETAVDLIPKL
jgi:hypothetical protein